MKIMKKLKCEDLPETDGVWEFHPLGKYWVSKAPAGAHNSLGPAVIYVSGESGGMSTIFCIASTVLPLSTLAVR